MTTRKEKHAEATAMAELAEGQRDEAPEVTIRCLRRCFPDLAENDLRAMALKHPDVARERRYWTRRIRAHRRTMAACKAPRQ
jgi:hypothetical protein